MGKGAKRLPRQECKTFFMMLKPLPSVEVLFCV